jgi:hypothetical protein
VVIIIAIIGIDFEEQEPIVQSKVKSTCIVIKSAETETFIMYLS